MPSQWTSRKFAWIAAVTIVVIVCLLGILVPGRGRGTIQCVRSASYAIQEPLSPRPFDQWSCTVHLVDDGSMLLDTCIVDGRLKRTHIRKDNIVVDWVSLSGTGDQCASISKFPSPASLLTTYKWQARDLFGVFETADSSDLIGSYFCGRLKGHKPELATVKRKYAGDTMIPCRKYELLDGERRIRLWYRQEDGVLEYQEIIQGNDLIFSAAWWSQNDEPHSVHIPSSNKLLHWLSQLASSLLR